MKLSIKTTQCFVIMARKITKRLLKMQKQLEENNLDVWFITYEKKETKKSLKFSARKNSCSYNEERIKAKFPQFKNKIKQHGFTLMPGNLDLCHLAFVIDHPQYAHYWFCEDDVVYSGHIGDFVSKFHSVNTDLLATNYRAMPVDWTHQSSLKSPINLDFKMHIVFLPFFRITHEAVMTIVDAYNNGWAGHHEISWPTILESYGRSIGDFKNYLPKCYTSSLDQNNLGPGTFAYHPPKLFYGFKKEKLFHPVKSVDVYLRKKLRRFYQLIKIVFRKNQ